MVVPELITQGFELTYLRLLKLFTFFLGVRAGVFGTLSDSLVLWGTVGVGGHCEVVGSAERDKSVLKDADAGEEDDVGLVFSSGAHCFYEAEVNVLGGHLNLKYQLVGVEGS